MKGLDPGQARMTTFQTHALHGRCWKRQVKNLFLCLRPVEGKQTKEKPMFGNLFAPVRQFFARLFCRHLHLKFIEEIQGARAQAMSIWQTPFKHECLDCGVAVFRSEKVEADNG